MMRATAVACFLVLLSSGCATRGSVRQVAADVNAIRAEVVTLRQAQETTSAQLQELASAVQTSRAATDGLQRAVTTTASDLSRVAARVDANDAAIRQMRETIAAQAAAAAAATAAAAAQPPPPPEPPRERRVSSAENTYAAGLANFQAREYGQAILDFLEVVTKHPRNPLAPSAQFWIAEAYYRQHDYRQALTEFQKVIDWESPNPKVVDALLKAGLCYSQLREDTRARAAWHRILREFPESPAAAEARQLLATQRPVPRRPSPSTPR